MVENIACGSSKGIRRIANNIETETIKLGDWKTEGGDGGDISMITNVSEIKNHMEKLHDIIEIRYKNGGGGENRNGKEGEKAIIRGMFEAMSKSGRLANGHCFPTMAVERIQVRWGEGDYWDNISGEWLNPDMVRVSKTIRV